MSAWRYEDKLRESQSAPVRRALVRAYRELWPASIILDVEALDDPVFQRLGRDVKVTLRGTRGKTFNVSICESIEEKIRSRRDSEYGDLLVEILSNQEMGHRWVDLLVASAVALVRASVSA